MRWIAGTVLGMTLLSSVVLVAQVMEGHRVVARTRGNWMYYDVTPLPHGRYFITDPGRGSDGQCRNSGSFTGHWITPGPPGGVAQEEIAINTSTCQIKWEEGDPLPGAENNIGAPPTLTAKG